jgi:hypothetical protein
MTDGGSGKTGFEQPPASGSHVPTVWQASLAAQTTGAPAHAPLVH